VTRSKRLAPAGRLIDERERQQAERLATCERRVADCEAKLAELKSYHADYERGFADRARQGTGAASLRDYQVFLGRLQQAISQQAEIVRQAQMERDAEMQRWQQAARHAKAVGTVMARWRTEEQYASDRRDQRESDERAQRPPPTNRGSR